MNSVEEARFSPFSKVFTVRTLSCCSLVCSLQLSVGNFLRVVEYIQEADIRHLLGELIALRPET